MPFPGLLHPEPQLLWQSNVFETLKHSSGSVSVESLCPVFVCALQVSVSPVLCKFLQLYDGVNGDFLQEGLCHTQVCCTQSLCPCSRRLLTRTSTGNTQTLKGRSQRRVWLSL